MSVSAERDVLHVALTCGCTLTSRFSRELLSRSFASCRLACCLLGTGHDVVVFAIVDLLDLCAPSPVQSG